MPLLMVDGLDDLVKLVDHAGQLHNDQLVNEMLKAGSEIVRNEWVKEIRSRDLISTPSNITKKNMISNVASSRPKQNRFGRLTYIYPQGEEIRKSGKKVRHAAKAFYQHYGYFNVRAGKFIPPKNFVTNIEKRAERLAVPVMTKIFEDYMNSITK
jgi:hypothetical protein